MSMWLAPATKASVAVTEQSRKTRATEGSAGKADKEAGWNGLSGRTALPHVTVPCCNLGHLSR